MNTLKTAAVVAVGLIALVGCQKSSVDVAAVEVKARSDMRKWIAAYNAGDVETIVAKYAGNAVVMAPGYPQPRATTRSGR